MPREKVGQKQRGIMAPVTLWERLDALAGLTGRTAAHEVIRAIERHLEAPPVVTRAEPPLAVEEVKVEPPPKKKRGRPRKASSE